MNWKLRKYPNLIDNFGYLKLQAKIKLPFFALLLFVGVKRAHFALALCRQAALALGLTLNTLPILA